MDVASSGKFSPPSAVYYSTLIGCQFKTFAPKHTAKEKCAEQNFAEQHLVKRWNAIGIHYLTFVFPVFNTTAGSTIQEWNHSTKQNYNTISCNKWQNL